MGPLFYAGKEKQMVYTCEYESPLGQITIACDEEAITGLWFIGQKYYAQGLPKKRIEKTTPLLEEAKRWLELYFSGRKPDFLPPLKYGSTPFRKLVCQIMLTIPYGHTMTYKAIAEEAAKRLHKERMSPPGHWRRRGTQPHHPHDPLPPGGRHHRKPHRLCRRHRKKSGPAETGKNRHARALCTGKGISPVKDVRPFGIKS